MGYIGEIGKRLTVKVTYKSSFEYTDYKFSYYGTTHFIHTFEDSEGNILVWKSTNVVEYVDGDEFKFIPTGSTVEMTGTVKEHSIYKDTEQTIITRCKFKLISIGKTDDEIRQEKAEAQKATITDKDFIWEMPYKQYKEHYSDCETIVGSFDRHEDSYGNCHGVPTIKVIIREGRLKNSGVRGQHFYYFTFKKDDHQLSYRAVCEENARKQMLKEHPNNKDWECIRIYNPRMYKFY